MKIMSVAMLDPEKHKRKSLTRILREPQDDTLYFDACGTECSATLLPSVSRNTAMCP